MKIISPLPRKRGRLEIIPLIDIMFFLLAAFMVVSIHKIKIDSLKINLPTNVPTQTHETREDFVSISIDTEGQVQIDKVRIGTKEEFSQRLEAMYAANHDQKILISADREAHHGDVMAALAKIRQAGFQKVAFAIKAEPAPDRRRRRRTGRSRRRAERRARSSDVGSWCFRGPGRACCTVGDHAPAAPAAPAPAPDAAAAPAPAPAPRGCPRRRTVRTSRAGWPISPWLKP
ncbi:MAG: biopolymer transporter ExbD [Verrucomicrobiota bacterium]